MKMLYLTVRSLARAGEEMGSLEAGVEVLAARRSRRSLVSAPRNGMGESWLKVPVDWGLYWPARTGWSTCSSMRREAKGCAGVCWGLRGFVTSPGGLPFRY